MVIVRQNRTNLNRALGLPYRDEDSTPDPVSKANIVLLLAGSGSSVAKKIHDRAEQQVTLEWRKTFLITDLSILTPAERSRWVESGETYCVVKVESGEVVIRGSTDDLQLKSNGRPSGKPSGRKIKSAFRKGERA